MIKSLAVMGLILAGVLSAPVMFAQEESIGRFEVAAVRVNPSNVRPRISLVPEAGRLTMTAVSVSEIIQAAYGVQSFELILIDSPVLKQRVDIVAKAQGPSSAAQLQRMLQPLLAERFKLAVRRETREMNSLLLVRVNKDGRLGRQMKQAQRECDSPTSGANRLALTNTPPPGEQGRCGMLPSEGPGHIRGAAIDMDTLASFLAPSQRQPVLNETGLEGRYDVDLTYTPDAFSRSSLAQRGGTAPPGIDPDGPSLVTALRDQLGLKMEPKRVPVKVIVIDHIESPGEN